MPDLTGNLGEFSEMPALHGEGSQTPINPSKDTLTPTGMSGAPKPMGQPGAPIGGAGGAGAPTPGAKPGMPGAAPPISPEDQLNYDSLDTLRTDITKIMNREDIENTDQLLDALLNEEWRTDRFMDLMDFREFDSIEQLFQDAMNKGYQEELDNLQVPPGLPVGAPAPASLPTGGAPIPPKKPDNDITGVNSIAASTKNLNTRSSFMKKVFLKDGTMIVKEAADASEVIEGISVSRRRLASVVNKYKDAYIKEAGIKALKKAGMPGLEGIIGDMGSDMSGGMGGIGPGPMSDPMGAPGGGLDGIIEQLKDAFNQLAEWVGKGSEMSGDESIGADDANKLDDEIGKSEDTMSDAKDVMAPKEDKPKEDENSIGASDGSDIKQAEKGSEEAMAVTMGTKGSDSKDSGSKSEDSKDSDSKDEKDDKKDDKEGSDMNGEKKAGDAIEVIDAVEDVRTEGTADETAVTDVTASELLNKLEQRVAELKKEANEYPFKDLNKQNVDNINAQTAKDQASTINSEIAGGAHSDSESIAPKEISTENPTVGKGEPKEAPGKKVSAPAAGKVSIEVAERVRQNSIDNERAKAKLSVELASIQQLKGLIDNPLKEAMIKNMEEAGLTKEAAEAIAFNSFIDGYESSQSLVMKEAFETFMEKDLDEFVKISETVVNYRMKEASELAVQANDEQRDVTASVDTVPLRGTKTSKEKTTVYKNFWEDVARDRI